MTTLTALAIAFLSFLFGFMCAMWWLACSEGRREMFEKKRKVSVTPQNKIEALRFMKYHRKEADEISRVVDAMLKIKYKDIKCSEFN